MSDPASIINPIKKTLVVLVGATVVLYLAVVGVAVLALNESSDLTAAICAFTENLEHRIQDAEQFLEENPNGIPGIPPELIEKQLADRIDTLESLDSISCP